MTDGADNVDQSDPFTLPWPPEEVASTGSDVDIDLREMERLEASFSETPMVTALVIAEHTGPYLSEVLLSLGDQSYDNLAVTVLNASGDDTLPDSLASSHPFATWVSMPAGTGFAALANWALDNVDETTSPFLLVLRDDVALAPGAVSYLVEEMFRSNAGIVGPKLVDWNDPSKLLSVGYGADRRGRRIHLIESDEFDQDQYSSVTDVFVIPSGAQLIRTDLFRHLGGFDPVMSGQNEDLDLCWRAHTVAARVVVVPQATGRIAQPIPSKALELVQYRERARHRLRTLAVTSSRWGFPRAMFGGIFALVLAAIGNLFRVRPGYARASLGAIMWNLRRLGGLRRRRRELRSIRQIGDSEIHALQSRIGPSVGSLVEQSLRPTARLADTVRNFRQSLVDERQRVGSTVAGFLGLAVLMIVLGTWDLIGESPVVAGSNPILPGGGDMLRQWWSGYRESGLGTDAASPLSFPILGLLSLAFSWSPNTLYLLLLIGPLFLAAFGTFRLVRPLGGPRAASVATALSVANPLTADALAAARWETLVLWAFAPFLLVSAARLADLAPWNKKGRPLPTRLVRFGALVAVAAAFAPAAVFVAMLASVGVVVFGLLSGRLFRVAYGTAGVVAAVVVPAVIHLRFTRDVLTGDRWDWMVGQHSPEESVEGFSQLIQFAVGRSSGSVLMWGLVAASSLGLLFGRKGRFDAALFGWSMAVLSFVTAWLTTTDLTPVRLPGSDVILTLAGAGLALAVGSSVRSVQIDLKRYGYGWRQFATIVAALGGIAVVLVGFGTSLDGRHNHPEVGYAEITTLLRSDNGESNILWLGDPRVVAANTSTSPEGGIPFAITRGGTTSLEDRFLPLDPTLDVEVGAMIDVAMAGDTVRLGRLLAPFGIDYVIFQPQLAPAPYEGPSFEIDAALGRALEDQLDMRRQPGTLNLLVLRNEASRGSAVVVTDSFDAEAESVVDLLATELGAARPVVPISSTATSVRFAADSSLQPGDQLLLSRPTNRWVPIGGASEVSETIGRTTLLTIEDPSVPFGLEYQPPRSWFGWLVVQGLMILGAFVAGARTSATPRPPAQNELVVDLRSDREIAREIARNEFEREPVGDAL